MRALGLTVAGREIQREDLPRAHPRGGPGRPERTGRGEPAPGQDAIIQQTLLETGGHVAEAARRLGVNKTTIYRRLKRASGARRAPAS